LTLEDVGPVFQLCPAALLAPTQHSVKPAKVVSFLMPTTPFSASRVVPISRAVPSVGRGRSATTVMKDTILVETIASCVVTLRARIAIQPPAMTAYQVTTSAPVVAVSSAPRAILLLASSATKLSVSTARLDFIC
jgi:hypothetical protein